MKLLFADCCISQRGSGSRTGKLCSAFLTAAAEADPQLAVTHLDLNRTQLQPFTVGMLNERDRLFKNGQFENEIYAPAGQFRDADGIVIGAPFWDLLFPAKLKIYIEHISANGVTYYYDEKGPHGCCKASWLVYLSSGGDFERPGNLGAEYWKQLCGMFGIRQYYSLFAGGLDAEPDKAEEFLNGKCREASALAKTLLER
jgi:FMN-dependent NADH-azoreductase